MKEKSRNTELEELIKRTREKGVYWKNKAIEYQKINKETNNSFYDMTN